MAQFRRVLKNKNFFCLWAGQIVSQFGDRLNQMALIALVYQKSPGSTLELAKLLSFIIIPVFIAGPIAGVYIDRWDRKRIMIFSDISRGFLVLLIPFCVLYLKWTFPVYMIVFLISLINRFFLPSKMAVIPSIVSKEELLTANSLSDTTRMIATVISLGCAGVLVAWVGVVGSFYIDALTFFISALFLSAITLNQRTPPIKEKFLIVEKALKDAIKRSVFKDIKEGFLYLIKQDNMRFIAATFLLLMSGLGAVICVVIVFIQKAFGTATSDLSLLGMFLGIGLFLGAVLYGRFGQRLPKDRLIFVNIAATGAGIAVFAVLVGVWRSFAAAAATGFIIGLFSGPIIVSGNTLAHETLPEGIRGRAFSSLEVVMHFGFFVFMLLASFLAEAVDRLFILVFIGCVFMIFGIGGALKRFRTNL